MRICPECKREIREGVTYCPFCGLRCSSPPPQSLPTPGFYVTQKKESSSFIRYGKLVILGILGGLLLVGIYWYLQDKPGLETIGGTLNGIRFERVSNASARRTKNSDFDMSLEIPGDPLGIASRDRELLVGNRAEPSGFLRLVVSGEDTYEIRKIPVVDPLYNQKVGFSTVAWNGKNYIGYTDGVYFQSSSKNIFTIHDPATLEVIKYYPAPELIGGLTWDGTGYWAATRRNTADSPEAAFLYNLDSNFQVVRKFDPPDIGCQGLAWDGSYLWFVDVFSDNIYLLTVEEEQVRVAHTYNTRFDYLSGIAFDGKNIWISEYDENRLHRLSPEVLAMWRAGEYRPVERASQTEPPYPSEIAFSSTDAQSSDSYHGSKSPPYSNDEAEVIDFSAEIDANAIYGSWNIYFGEDFFADGSSSQQNDLISMPTFARYRITVRGGDLSEPVVLTYDAEAGENIRTTEQLVSSVGAGTYNIELFLHVQYVDREGTNRIINESIPGLELVYQ